MKEQEPTFVALAELTSLKLAYQKYDLTLMPNVGQLSLICVVNSFAINTVKLKQRSTKRKTETEQNATVLRIRFFETKCDQTFTSYCKISFEKFRSKHRQFGKTPKNFRILAHLAVTLLYLELNTQCYKV